MRGQQRLTLSNYACLEELHNTKKLRIPCDYKCSTGSQEFTPTHSISCGIIHFRADITLGTKSVSNNSYTISPHLPFCGTLIFLGFFIRLDVYC